ncbi:unnamed protein product [Spirodela intermedia]|uniref:Sodium/calcium exchanger membrane region domain-containing protein n=1 Tax=Spirodela intermedia TaxID=51605 RepID=A0A7I8KN28_SPIIN|nr:unnamed protein product [Spirodela intermedia]
MASLLLPCGTFFLVVFFFFFFLGKTGTVRILGQGGGAAAGGDGCKGLGDADHGGRGYVNYLRFFYCLCGGAPWLGYPLLGLWLLVLFFLLGTTAGDYFCPSLEELSSLLRLPPAVAGATLLALGNGAPDFFASVVSFAAGGRAADEVGLSSVLGGAFFVSTVVVGVISVAVGGGAVTVAVDRFCFLRDLCFLAAALCSLTAVLAIGRINLWGAIFFLSLYFVYVLAISTTACCRRSPLEGLSASLLAGEEEKEDLEGGAREEPKSPRRRGWWRSLLAAPLHLPRRLTIPVVSEERWSKPFAVASAALSPPFLAALWTPRSTELLLAGGLLGLILGGAAVATTERSLPPKGLLQLPWLAVGFLMSIVWAYLAAGELVALLVSLGRILGINPSVLGLTVLAWGNSLGDLTANVAMAVYGGAPGAQVAFSGCYAGPIFNTLVGLGISLLFSAWWSHPSSFPVPAENSSYQLLGFMAAGLLWAAVILTRREMKVDRVLGLGLLTIYCSFLSVRVSDSLGWL